MNYGARPEPTKQIGYQFAIGDVAADKRIPRIVRHEGKVFRIASVRERV
jgi:hypothetical protein